MKTQLLKRDYSWEEIIDIEEQVCDATVDLEPEFPGVLRITVEYVDCTFCDGKELVNICPECEKDTNK